MATSAPKPSGSNPDQAKKPGLRERKKTRTKAMIRDHALRLFKDQGYHNTTVDDIAKAAEVAPSTVFRYFPNKYDLVDFSDYLDHFISAFRRQPAELTLIRAIREANRDIYGEMSARQKSAEAAGTPREVSILSIAELGTMNLLGVKNAAEKLCAAVGERIARNPGDLEVQCFVGACMGALTPIWARWARDQETDLDTEIDRAIEQLENGTTLS